MEAKPPHSDNQHCVYQVTRSSPVCHVMGSSVTFRRKKTVFKSAKLQKNTLKNQNLHLHFGFSSQDRYFITRGHLNRISLEKSELLAAKKSEDSPNHIPKTFRLKTTFRWNLYLEDHPSGCK